MAFSGNPVTSSGNVPATSCHGSCGFRQPGNQYHRAYMYARARLSFEKIKKVTGLPEATNDAASIFCGYRKVAGEVAEGCRKVTP